MQLKGVSLGFTDCDVEVAAEFNRWYDLDHVPENIALPELLGARRYVATPELKAARGTPALPAFQNGAGTYLACYWVGVEDYAGTGKKMGDLFQTLLKQRRIFKKARIVYSDRCRLVKAFVGKHVPPLAPDAIPYQGHSAVTVAITEVADKSRQGELEQWWDQVHLPDIVSVPGIVGALRFESTVPEYQGRVTFMFLMDGDPRKVQANLAEATKQWAAQGRVYPPDKRPHRSLFSGGYQMIQPLQYDWLK